MAGVAAQVHVVATDGPAGRAGATATAVLSVSLEPPTMLVCLSRTGSTLSAIEANRVFCVNALAAGDEAVAEAFAGRAGLDRAQRFTVGRWRAELTGAPVLASALAVFDCRLTEVRDVATHRLVIGEVVAAFADPLAEALVYRGRHYHRLGR
jgi:flavin reductase (DIM6/NTAB) family NADH-FMN oxidoreductase RutF